MGYSFERVSQSSERWDSGKIPVNKTSKQESDSLNHRVAQNAVMSALLSSPLFPQAFQAAQILNLELFIRPFLNHPLFLPESSGHVIMNPTQARHEVHPSLLQQLQLSDIVVKPSPRTLFTCTCCSDKENLSS
jgi:hypothetical protein